MCVYRTLITLYPRSDTLTPVYTVAISCVCMSCNSSYVSPQLRDVYVFACHACISTRDTFVFLSLYHLSPQLICASALSYLYLSAAPTRTVLTPIPPSPVTCIQLSHPRMPTLPVGTMHSRPLQAPCGGVTCTRLSRKGAFICSHVQVRTSDRDTGTKPRSRRGLSAVT